MSLIDLKVPMKKWPRKKRRDIPFQLVLIVSMIFLPLLVTADQGLFRITESSLVEALKESNPDLKNIEAQSKMSQFQDSRLREQYQWNVTGKISHSDSNEKSVAAFFPTFGPTYRFETGLNKKLQYGMHVDAGVFVDQQSTTNKIIDQATRTGVSVGFSVDLWKNLFGRIDQAQLEDQGLLSKKVRIQSEINKQVVMLEMRKLYWSLVGNDLQLKITNQLLRTSKSQLREAKKRGKQYIADKGEIARYNAQVNSRLATIKSLEYQRDLMVQTLKQALPHLSSANIVLASVDLDNYYVNVYQCAQRIGSYREIPWDNTKLDDLLSLVESSYKRKTVISDRYSDIDIQLNSKIQSSGVDQGYSNSFDDFNGNGQIGYQVALQFSLPLGESSKKSKSNQVSVDYHRFISEKNKLLGQVQAKHTQIIRMVGLLREAVESIRKNGDNLAISIKVSQRKFKQARISINDLLAEQDALLNSRLSEVDTKLQVIHTLLDYFQTYTDDSCNTSLIGAR